ncbi:MAG: M28 family peptidase [Crocinitomicaceae bacterium]|nr:M28 family peptidase [Crocinitomicaceae bacterium]MDG1658541.1 M28 family peptidase [Crocinitomicaceae bacterium]
MKNIFLVVFSMTSGLMASAQTIPGVIETQLDALINREGYRTYDDTVTLNAVRDYIVDEFSTHADVTYRQDYLVNGVTYSNVIALVGDTTLPRIIVGAHYDVCENQHGADDNGTGVVGLFQALEQLKDYSSEDYCIEFVAYTLEEPPFFRTTKMGSYIHAKSLHARGIEVHGMLSLEMIGYFSTEKKSQHYPIGILKLFYGGKGDYITVVRKMNKGKFARKFSRKYKHSKTIKTKKFTAPQSLPGIDFSDHLNYWALGYDAIMLTDTAFFRNANYHQGTDTIDTIDFDRMAKVIDGLVNTLELL